MLEWNPEVSMGNVILGSLLLLTFVGLIFNYVQMRKSWRQKRAEFLITLAREYVLDRDLAELYYQIDYEKFQFDESILDSDQERKLDKLLYMYENIARVYVMDNLNKADIKYFAFRFIRVYQSAEVKKYLAFLNSAYGEKLTVKPFEAFQKVGPILEKEFSRR
ncbi:MAG: hypothetical protein JSU81_07010 [Candidatus Coatesbacteria bacterium]|nr:MAG: hypothetical protein JSU81_07010 [Candidatus Coatesbacteria bacterium]